MRDNEYYISEIIIINRGDITFGIVHNPNWLRGFDWWHMLKIVFILTCFTGERSRTVPASAASSRDATSRRLYQRLA